MLSHRFIQNSTAFLIVVFCATLVLFAYLSRRPLCIDSKLVEKIDRVVESGTHTAYRCSLRKHVAYDGGLNNITQEYAQRLAPVERFIEYLGGFRGRLTITLMKSSEVYFKIQDHQIYATENFLNLPGQLEKTVLKIWLHDQGLAAKDQSLAEEVLSDLFWAAAEGHLNIEDPFTRLNLDEEPRAQWPEMLRDTVGLCQTPWWLSRSAAICQALRQTKQNPGKIDLGSVRPLLSQSLIETYEQIPAAKKMTWLKALISNLSLMHFPETESRTDKSFSAALRTVRQWMSNFRSFDDHFANRFSQQLELHGFRDLTATVHFQALVIYDQIPEQVQRQVEENLQSLERSHLIGYQSGDQIQFSSRGISVTLGDLGAWQADKVIWLGCGSPALDKLKEYSAQTERLLFVDACHEKQTLNIASYLHADAQNFAAKNKAINFIEFHLPSLQLALQKLELQGNKDNDWIRELLKGSAEGQPQKSSLLTEVLGWQEPHYHSQEKAYRSQSAIEAIEWYRVN
jgi:hypothetical protein